MQRKFAHKLSPMNRTYLAYNTTSRRGRHTGERASEPAMMMKSPPMRAPPPIPDNRARQITPERPDDYADDESSLVDPYVWAARRMTRVSAGHRVPSTSTLASTPDESKPHNRSVRGEGGKALRRKIAMQKHKSTGDGAGCLARQDSDASLAERYREEPIGKGRKSLQSSKSRRGSGKWSWGGWWT